jgi:hypothetical protein
VLSWADETAIPPGAAYVDDTTWRYVFPIGQLPKQLGPAGSGVVFPDTVREVIFVRDTCTRRYVRLPDPVMVKAAQEEMQGVEDYGLPQFYRDPPLNCGNAETKEQKLRLQKQRVGDYSIGSCM